VIGGLPSGDPVELDVDDPELLPKVLQEKGYRTALIGKWHLTSGNDPNESGFDYWAGFLRGALDGPPPIGYYQWPQIINGGAENDQYIFATTENVDQAIGFITEPADTPWFVSLNFAAPHWPYQLPPEVLVNDGTDEGSFVYNKVIVALGSYTQPPPPTPPAPPLLLRKRRAIFNAMIYAMDSEIGRLLLNVDLANTCIIFIGDNGTQGRGGPGARINNVVVPPFDLTKAKGTLYEGGIRVPMVVYDPEIKKPGGFTNALVNTVDIYAMILKIAGCPSPNRFDGKHFKAVLESTNDDDVSVRNFIYADIERGGSLNQAIRNDRYKIIFNRGEPEFYDLLEDPFEETNLLLGDLTNKEKSNYKWLLNKLENLLAS
jgi:arylsulfatase A-like enzyme